ncbi:hypothetical protein KKC1_33770, partial [Calderihabitans maritimus]
MHPFDWLE